MPRGVLHIANPADYHDHRPDTATQEALELLASIAPFAVAPPPVPPPVDWLRITQAVRRGTRLSLQAERPGFSVSIGFDTVAPFEGNYHISAPTEHRSENGTIATADTIDGNRLVDHRHAMLRSFELRYVVTTTAADRSGTQRIWRIGVSDVTVPEEQSDSDATPNV